jgi:uncharacterized protein
MKIYIDADACPVKDEVYRVAERYKIHVVVVANQRINIPPHSWIEMKTVRGDFDGADNWIIENSQADDIVVTADILLADRCIRKAVRVIGNKGEEFTEDNIGFAVAGRELAQNLRHMGQLGGGPAPMDKKARSRFLGTLDQIIQSILRKSPK